MTVDNLERPHAGTSLVEVTSPLTVTVKDPVPNKETRGTENGRYVRMRVWMACENSMKVLPFPSTTPNPGRTTRYELST
jgi:hypothetical protein